MTGNTVASTTTPRNLATRLLRTGRRSAGWVSRPRRSLPYVWMLALGFPALGFEVTCGSCGWRPCCQVGGVVVEDLGLPRRPRSTRRCRGFNHVGSSRRYRVDGRVVRFPRGPAPTNSNPTSVDAATAVPAEPTLGPAQALEIYDSLAAKIEAVLEQGRALVETRTLMLHYVADQTTNFPMAIGDQLSSHGKIESRLRRLETIDVDVANSDAGHYRLSRLLPLIDQDRHARREIRRLERLIDGLLD